MPVTAREIEAARRFTRFYTRQAELLDEAFLDSRFSLSEGRVLYELSARGETSAAELGRDLGLDRGYLSRMLKAFESDGLLERHPFPGDGRQQRIALTPAGRDAFAPLDALSETQWRARLSSLSRSDRARLLAAMNEIEGLLGGAAALQPIVLRPHAVGDLGWVARRQGLLYAREYGFDASFEALVAEILVDFVRTHDPTRERGWIAERDGDILGSIYCVRQSDSVAKLRLLYVEPETRGSGLGSRLVAECIAFARACGYATLTLWTNDCLDAARHIYVKAGFLLVEEERHHSFGRDLVGQNWTLDL
jgi:DNA-binding MarR family transcriptional regulator/N-acetylglutamate synthase-like GNAT family acetyltransferase